MTTEQPEARTARPAPPDDPRAKSHNYLRTAMVGLVLCLAVSVVHQSWTQGSILSSISAYYYTPAQSIFVGALVAIGVCMIALKGTTDADDVLLNIGGMLAPVVAIVPTARDAEQLDAVNRCRQPDGTSTAEQALTGNCPTVAELADATAANVGNNMLALLVAAAAGLGVSVLFAVWARHRLEKFLAGFAIASGLVAVVAIFFGAAREFFIEVGHYAAAIPMFGCIVAVVVVNALRHQEGELADTYGERDSLAKVLGALFRSPDRYAVVALAMIAAVGIGVPLALAGTFETAVFWLEASLILLFGAFWIIQTKEQWHGDRPPPARSASRPVGLPTS